MKEQINEIENELKAEGLREILTQYSVYLTSEQATAIDEQVKRRRNAGFSVSFSSIIREALESGFSSVSADTETLESMKRGRN
jgi:hypothetical protein